MKDIKYAARMLLMAEKDFKALQNMRDTNSFDDEIFGFHAQQAVEKAVKSLLSLISVKYPRTHDLDVLFALLSSNGFELPAHFFDLLFLTDFAVAFRYDALEDIEEDIDRDSTIRMVQEFLDFVKGKLTSHQ